jgi:lipoprotein-anchoring transpeptidase ErfK/SrfK
VLSLHSATVDELAARVICDRDDQLPLTQKLANEANLVSTKSYTPMNEEKTDDMKKSSSYYANMRGFNFITLEVDARKPFAEQIRTATRVVDAFLGYTGMMPSLQSIKVAPEGSIDSIVDHQNKIDKYLTVVDKSAQKFYFLDRHSGAIVDEMLASTGLAMETPEGFWTVTSKQNSTEWVHNGMKGLYSKWFYGINTPVNGIGIHATPFKNLLGSKASEGCIRAEDIDKFDSYADIGSKVLVTSSFIENYRAASNPKEFLESSISLR